MGNTSSNEPVEIKSLSTQIDDIAVHYILKQNTIDLLRLTDQEYYDNLVVLIGNVFQKRLTDMEIGALNQRMFPETIQDVVLDLLPQGKTKDTIIQNISRFYVKIMMVYSAIVSTIDPQYSYEDASGEKQLFYLKDIHAYKKIPRHAQPVVHQLTNPMNLCRKRISILRNKIDLTDPDFITINPGEKMCSTDPAIRLTDEIGIQELDLLYYDIFDPETNSWKSRSPEMEAKYARDLKTFYTSFTGRADMPESIRKFKDIELFDFRSLEYCRDPLFTHDFVVSKDDELIVRYKEQVELLEEKTTHYRNLLLTNLRKLFTAKSIENTLTYSIRSTLTLQEILIIEKETRNTIIELYTQCEQYFIRALLIFEEIYDHQSKRMNESRIKNLDERYQPLYEQEMLIAPLTPQNIERNLEPMESNGSKNMKGTITPINTLIPPEPIAPVTIPAPPVYTTPVETPLPVGAPLPAEGPLPVETTTTTSVPLPVTPSPVTPAPSSIFSLFNTKKEPIPSPDPSPDNSKVSDSSLSTPIESTPIVPSSQRVSPIIVTPSRELVTPSPEPSPELVTPSPELVTPSPDPSPELVTPSPELVTPLPEPSPELVTPSPELVTPSPELVTPLPEPSPEIVTPSPEPSPELVTPSPELVTPVPEPSPELVTPVPELVTPEKDASSNQDSPMTLSTIEKQDPAVNRGITNSNIIPSENKIGSTNSLPTEKVSVPLSKNIILKKNITNTSSQVPPSPNADAAPTPSIVPKPVASNSTPSTNQPIEAKPSDPLEKKETIVEKITNLFKTPKV